MGLLSYAYTGFQWTIYIVLRAAAGILGTFKVGDIKFNFLFFLVITSLY